MKNREAEILWFEDVSLGDIGKVGGKNASLGEMVSQLKSAGVRVPDGFATTAAMFRRFLRENDLEEVIKKELQRLKEGRASLQSVGRKIRQAILQGEFSRESRQGITRAYQELGQRFQIHNVDVAVRSSATAEDLPDASFAGQQESFLNIQGPESLLDACRRCYASLYTDRAISYREQKGFEHLKVALSVGVQKMVRSDLWGSGVAFTLDTESGFPDVVLINAAWGLGELVVQGAVSPDEYQVYKPLLKEPALVPIVQKKLGKKSRKMVYSEGGTRRIRTVKCTKAEQETFVLSDDQILQLARWCAKIEDHYGRPMDIEWAVDGQAEELFILQARPETVQAAKEVSALKSYHLKEKGEVLVQGTAIGDAIISAPVCRLESPSESEKFIDGAILVTEVTHPDWVVIMKRASGIITEQGGRTSHAAIVSRELGVPAIVGAQGATTRLKNKEVVTLSCAEGDQGVVYKGALDFEVEELDLSTLKETRTDIMVNIASPGASFRYWRLPLKGVGLLRMEFIIENIIKIHPMALVRFDELKDRSIKREIEELTKGYGRREDYFVEHLSLGIGRIAASQYPHPVIVRTSDFKTNEYAELIGGAEFEPQEENPMLGFRGASRYYHELYQEGFALECQAIKRVREVMGFENIIVMIPFCRTLGEADRVLEVMAKYGLKRGLRGLEVYMMCEIPSNVILAEEFARRFDGFSIGSNDLTQLILGVDRDSALLTELFDEHDEAVRRTIQQLIEVAHKSGVKVGLCGQAPSDHPDFAAFLVHCGIDSISINPDKAAQIIPVVARAERELSQAPSGGDGQRPLL